MSYLTELQVVANGLDHDSKCHICDRELGGARRELWIKKHRSKVGLFGPRDHDGGRSYGQLLAVWKPTPGNLAIVPDVSVNKMSAAVANSPLFHSPEGNVPLEVRQMIFGYVVGSNHTIDILGHRLCAHVDGIEVCMNPRDSEFEQQGELYAALLRVSKQVQLEVLQVLFKDNVINLADTEPPPSAMVASDPGCMQKMQNDGKYMGAAGWEVLMSTFRPFCQRIRAMRLTTFFDADHVGISALPKDYGSSDHPIRTPQTCLMRTDLPSIFSNLSSLTIYMDSLRVCEKRVMPRFLVEPEFLFLFRRLKGLRLTDCEVTMRNDYFRDIDGNPQMRMRGRRRDRICWYFSDNATFLKAFNMGRGLEGALCRDAVEALKENNMKEGCGIEFDTPETEPEKSEEETDSQEVTDSDEQEEYQDKLMYVLCLRRR